MKLHQIIMITMMMTINVFQKKLIIIIKYVHQNLVANLRVVVAVDLRVGTKIVEAEVTVKKAIAIVNHHNHHHRYHRRHRQIITAIIN